jgi:hypothetical protein
MGHLMFSAVPGIWMDGWMDSVYQGTDGVIHGLDWMVPWGWVFRPGLEVNNTPRNKIFVHKVIGLDWIGLLRSDVVVLYCCLRTFRQVGRLGFDGALRAVLQWLLLFVSLARVL